MYHLIEDYFGKLFFYIQRKKSEIIELTTILQLC